MKLNTETTVGQLVAENPARARVFEKYRIDYCCGGKIPLAEACTRKSADAESVMKEIEAIDAEGVEEGTDWTKAPLGDLADHIVDKHHAYLATELPRLKTMSARVAKVHGHHAPEVKKLHEVFLDFQQELKEHARKEEEILFPWIRSLERGEVAPMMANATVASPIHCMEEEHDHAGQALETVRELTNNFQPPMDACNTWRVLYASLKTLEADMHVHIHKENSILFPRAIQFESQRNQQDIKNEYRD